MAAYLSPGVYIKEVSSGVKSIAAAGTSTGAFVGITNKGPENVPVFIPNFSSFQKTFGGFLSNGYLPHAVYSFFQEGGSSCYVVRVAGKETKAASGELMAGEGEDGGKLFVHAASRGSWGNRIKINISDPTDDTKTETHFNMVVTYTEGAAYEYKNVDTVVEKYENMSFVPSKDGEGNALKDPQGNVLFTSLARVNGDADGNGASGIIKFTDVPAWVADKRPANAEYTLSGGADSTDADFTRGIHMLDMVDDILNICVPDKAGDREVTINALAYCEKRTDCFFLADPPANLEPMEVKDYKAGKVPAVKREGMTYWDEGSMFASSYGALYYPWVYISDPLTGLKRLVPPSGLMAGIYSYSDNNRGVHKAPAGTGVGRVKTAVGLERTVMKPEHDQLHPQNINVIRNLPNNGTCVWGASTLSNDPEWKYINIRRLFMQIRVSIYRGTQYVVFEPNDPSLWAQVNRNVSSFLLGIWRTGALFGSSQSEAFFVKVDAENNPQDAIDRGELHIDIGVAPVKPAEYVIFTIRQKSPSE